MGGGASCAPVSSTNPALEAAADDKHCREHEKEFAAQCSFSTWYPDGACGLAWEALSGGRRGDAKPLVEECAWHDQAFASYARATLNRSGVDVGGARSALESAIAEGRSKGCKPCQSLAERDLGLSLIMREPHDAVRGNELLLSSCRRLLEEPILHLDARLGTHPCELVSDKFAYETWVSAQFSCARIERGCHMHQVSNHGQSE